MFQVSQFDAFSPIPTGYFFRPFGPEEISFVQLSRPRKEMNTRNVSGYPQFMLDCLSERLHDGVACLLQNFQVFVNSGVLEIVLHSVKNCAFFFGLSHPQQQEVVRASFNPFLIDGQGRLMASASTAHTKSRLTKPERRLLCISYAIHQNGPSPFRQVLMMFKKKISRKIETDLAYFKRKQDIFFVDETGYVHLINVPAIRWDYVNFIVAVKIFTSGVEQPLLKCKNKSQNKQPTKNKKTNEEILQLEVDKSKRKENVVKNDLNTKSRSLSDEEKIDLMNVYHLSQQSNSKENIVLESNSVDCGKDLEVTEDLTSGEYDIKTNETKYLTTIKATCDVPTIPPFAEKSSILSQENQPPPRDNTNWCKSSNSNDFGSAVNYNASRANSVLQMDSLYSMYSQWLLSINNVSKDIFSETDTSQEKPSPNGGGCAALKWTEISIFEQDKSYYNNLIDFLLSMPQKK